MDLSHTVYDGDDNDDDDDGNGGAVVGVRCGGVLRMRWRTHDAVESS